MFQSGLSGGVPAVVAVVDVCAYHVGCHVSNAADVAIATCLRAEFTWAPEAALTKMSAQPGMLAKEFKSALSLKQVERARDAHLGWESDKNVHMVGFNIQFKDIHSVFMGNLQEEYLAVFAHKGKVKGCAKAHALWGIHRILGLCLRACPTGTHKVERILSYATIVANQSFHFSSIHAYAETAHTNQMQPGECANYAAHSPIKERRNKEVQTRTRYSVIEIPLPPKGGSILATM